MKMIYCTCNVSMLEDLVQAIEGMDIHEYQVIEKVTARGHHGDPRLDTPVWPGYNSAVLMQIRDREKVNNVMDYIREINKSAYNEGEVVTACTWSLDDYVFE